MSDFDDRDEREKCDSRKGGGQQTNASLGTLVMSKPAKVPSANLKPSADQTLNTGLEGVLKTVQTEFAELRKKANLKLNASINGAIQEMHKFLATGHYLKDELGQLPQDVDETKDLVAEQVALGEHQQNNAVVALTQATKENYLVGEGVVAGVQAREKALALANLDPKERKSMVKDAVAEYDDAVKQLREYVTTTA